MVFSSITFLLYFLPIFLLIYQISDKRFKNYTILAASILFYSWGAPKFVYILLGSTFLDYFIVNGIYRSKKTNYKRLLLFSSISINLGLLIYFKYANFFIENLNVLLTTFGFNSKEWTKVILPIGISFYTFQTLTYSIDVYRGVHAPLKKVTDYLLYIMSFPQMIAGPIVRFNTIADQITERKETIDDKLIGFFRFCIGLGKKVLIANVMAEQADLIFNQNIESLSSSAAWLGIIAYTFQIYFDFSGYSDMAIGLGRMIGFKFPENFNSPYLASNISEFWRRWHITLGDFMKNYLYIPLGGNRVKNRFRLYGNLWIVFLLSGLWHGASWNFVIWGAYHGFFLILDKVFLINTLNRLGKIPATFITFLVVVIGWIPFRMETIDETIIFLKQLFSFNSADTFETAPGFILILSIAILFSIITSFKKGKQLEYFFFFKNNYKSTQYIGLSLISILIFILSVSSIVSSGFNPFIYFRF